MSRAEVTGNSIEIWMYRSDLALLAASAVMLVVLFAFAGWRVALTALALSLASAGVLASAQRSGMRDGATG